MSPAVRKLMLSVHLVFSVGWIGAVLAYLALDVAAANGDPSTMHAAWTAMALIGSWVLIPLALGSLLTGAVMALGTPWGLLRHYWVLISFILTTFATLVLISHMPDVNAIAATMQMPSDASSHGSGGTSSHGSGRGDFLHAGGGLAVLLFVAVLNVYKPRGMTRYGWNRLQRSRTER